jgi:hypothetical protein
MIRAFVREQMTVDGHALRRLGPVRYVLRRTVLFLAAIVLIVGGRLFVWRIVDPRFAYGAADVYLLTILLLPLTMLVLNIVAVWRALHGRR